MCISWTYILSNNKFHMYLEYFSTEHKILEKKELGGPTIGGPADHLYEAHYPPMLCGLKKHAPKQVSTIGWRVCFLWMAHKLSTWINRPTHHIRSIEVVAPPHTHSRRRKKAPHQRGATYHRAVGWPPNPLLYSTAFQLPACKQTQH